MSSLNYSGLNSSQVEEKLKTDGLNTIPEAKNVFIKKVIGSFLSPISFMLLAASILSFYSNKAFDGFFIFFLLILNSSVTLWQERKADNAIKKLNQNLSSLVNVFRDGKWKKVDSRELVKGDVVKIDLGGVIPADGKIIDAKNISVNQSALTGESLPQEKKVGDTIYSGSFLITGLAIIEITATGAKTYFGKTMLSVEKIRKKSILEQDIIHVSQFLSALSILAIVILSVVFIYLKINFVDIVTLSLALLIAGIPISLPTVMSLIIELGVIELTKKNVIIRRLSALEDLSNVNFLLTDKTGTLTKNLITVNKIISYKPFSDKDAIEYAYLTSVDNSETSINQAIIRKTQALSLTPASYKILDFTPIDLEKKITSVVVKNHEETVDIVVGAPQEIEKLCSLTNDIKQKFKRDVDNFAGRGFRAVAVAAKNNGQKDAKMKLVGLLSLSDELREEAKEVVSFLKQNGIETSMVTGDNRAISAEIVKKLGLDDGDVLTKSQIEAMGWDKVTRDTFIKTGAFSEILPEDKLHLVQLAKKYFVVASNGDGINDLPALKEANVGIAVKNAVDTLKATADIVLLSNGIGVIKDAIIEARKIFERVYTYSVYRISESQRLIATILVLGILYKTYPLTPLQLILLALLNDIPIISLAFDRIKVATKPSRIKTKQRFILSSMYGFAGIANSLVLFFLMISFFHLSWNVIQTIFFLKLTISGHMLIYVAHTKQRWYKFLPSRQVIFATVATQVVASCLALTGLFMSSSISIFWIIFVWIWAFLWMQVTEGMKILQQRLSNA